MSKDRAAAVASALIAIFARCLRSDDVRREITEVLREEFHDAERRPDEPSD